MDNTQFEWKPPEDWDEWAQWLSLALHGRHRWRLVPVLIGMLLGHGRKTVSAWLRAAGVTFGYQGFYYLLSCVGRKAEWIAGRLLQLLLKHLPSSKYIVFVTDDTPTARFGPYVEGASIHRNPTPGPADHKFVYGHIWVTLFLTIRHWQWGTLVFPLLAKLYVRREKVASVPEERNWEFATKIELAMKMLRWIAPKVQAAGKQPWLAVDGGYAAGELLEECHRLGVVVVGRLRKDAALRTVPDRLGKVRKRGRPRKYGCRVIDLTKRAAQPQGWEEVECQMYGKRVTKRVKTFLATWKPARGPIRVVLVREPHTWVALFCTDIHAPVRQILEAYSDRAAVEQGFRDLKEVWGAGEQQLRNIWANVGAFHLNLWSYSLVELWSWGRTQEELTDRSQSPWDDPSRRPSHADRRKALQRSILRNEFSRLVGRRWESTKIGAFLSRLLNLAT
jgi:hypothetical protein